MVRIIAHAGSSTDWCWPIRTYLIQKGFHIANLRGVHASTVECMRLLVDNIQQHFHNRFTVFLHTIVLFHTALQFFFHAFALALGRFQDFIVGRRDRLSAQQGHHVGRGAISNGQVQGCVVIIVLLVSSFRVCIVQGFDNFQWSIVVSSIVKWQVSVVILLGSSFRKDFEQELFGFNGSLLPGRKVQGQVSVIVGQARCFGVSFQERFNHFYRSTKRRCRVKW